MKTAPSVVPSFLIFLHVLELVDVLKIILIDDLIEVVEEVYRKHL